ncbi:hypothetical protein BGZ58_003910 [Dissophora ornata]|nr:hypothetical protein BGZ58_003910 [Dissophora ornata]
MSLGNIHAIAQSHQCLLKAVSTQSESSNWFTLIESTGWLNHVADLLKAASGRDGIVGKMLDANCSVLVHCTDGWDRTTQLVSLAQILLDPYYRTIHGLRVLIEKEWLSSGHPFQSRTEACSSQKKPGSPSPMDEEPLDSWRSSKSVIHSSPNGAKESISFARKWRRTTPYSDPSLSHHMEPRSPPTEASHHLQSNSPLTTAASPASPPPGPPQHQQSKQMPVQTVPISPSPVFLLFLTCLHHIVLQHPNRFEYNDYLLVVLARAVSGSSPFGDFLYNDERERAQDRLRQRTPSIWKWIYENHGWFTNRDYIPKLDQTSADNRSAWRQNVLHVQTGGRFNTLWSEYYFNTTPALYPDPRTVLATAPFHVVCRSRQPLLSQQHRMGILTDRWRASQFDEEQLQQLVYPGPFTSPTRQHQLRSGAPSKTLIIPPALALLKGQDMRLYFELVGKLRDRREEKARQTFLKWQAWAKRQREEKPAREDGWDVVRGRSGSNSSQGDSALYHEDECDEWDRKGSLDGRRTPELKVVVARKGIEVAMGRILDGGPFFGAGSLVYDDDPESEDENGAAGMGDRSEDRVVTMAELDEDDLEGAFDDFGFPVNTDDTEVFVAV